MFQFGRFPRYAYFIQRIVHDSSSWRFPHSEIRGSRLICSSPRLIAACHVFLRLLMPRHSPCALVRLNSFYERSYPLMVHSILSRIAESRFTVYLEFKLAYHRVIGKIVFVTLFLYLERPLISQLKSFPLWPIFISKDQSRYCFVFLIFLFFLFGFQWTFRLSTFSLTFIKLWTHSRSLECVQNLRNVGWPKWTRTTDLVLIRHAL